MSGTTTPLIDQALFDQLLEEIGPDPDRQSAFLASMANTFVTLAATATLTKDTDLERLRLMAEPWAEGIPEDPEQRQWVNSLAQTTGQEMDRLMVRAFNRARRVFEGKAPGTGNGF